jgi:UMP-CMP kinase
VITEGKIVSSEITIDNRRKNSIIKKAINSAASDKILIDGFPRSEENRIAFEKIVSLIYNQLCFDNVFLLFIF